MDTTAPETKQVLSPEAYGLILTSKYLREMLLPQGLRVSPYEVIDYKATLTLHDHRGVRATFRRRQRIRFLQQGVGGILDHAWGEGNLLTKYRHSAGTLQDSFRDHDRLHMVVELPRPMKRGEELAFQVEREAIDGFTSDLGVLETTIDHPVQNVVRSIVFPESRPVHWAVLHYDSRRFQLSVLRRTDGRTEVGFHVAYARADTPYTIHWAW